MTQRSQCWYLPSARPQQSVTQLDPVVATGSEGNEYTNVVLGGRQEGSICLTYK